MMFLRDEGELALGSRFKALSESLYALANRVYQASGVALDAHGFPLLRYIQVKGPASVTQIADAIGQTHSAVSQSAAKLRRAGWLTRRSDRQDARRGVLDLSPEAERCLDRMGPIWSAIQRGAHASAERGAGPLLDTLSVLETDIDNGRLFDRIIVERDRLRAAKPEVHAYRAQWREHFKRINAHWLERYFALEDIDREILGHPQETIIDRGGAVFFALLEGDVIGTCALLKEARGVYELSKMAVAAGFRGLGAGRLLLDAAIAAFIRRRGTTLFLESNKRLGPALHLYESAGFVHQPAPRPGSHYQRSDVYMIYRPQAARGKSRARTTARRSGIR